MYIYIYIEREREIFSCLFFLYHRAAAINKAADQRRANAAVDAGAPIDSLPTTGSPPVSYICM